LPRPHIIFTLDAFIHLNFPLIFALLVYGSVFPQILPQVFFFNKPSHERFTSFLPLASPPPAPPPPVDTFFFQQEKLGPFSRFVSSFSLSSSSSVVFLRFFTCVSGIAFFPELDPRSPPFSDPPFIPSSPFSFVCRQ